MPSVTFFEVIGQSRLTTRLMHPNCRSGLLNRDAVFLVDGMGDLTALAKTDLSGNLNYIDHSIVEVLFQTFTVRIKRFHPETVVSQAPRAG